MEHILSLSYGKDSLACLGAIEELGLPLDRIVHAEIWATDTVPADPPTIIEFKEKADRIIKERYGIEVEHIRAKRTYEDYFYTVCSTEKYGENHIYGFPTVKGGWCGKLKLQVFRTLNKPDIIQYIGIAADEPDRFHNQTERKKLPLVTAEWDESKCREWCEQNDLLSPIYTTTQRSGCWFCPNQPVEQLRQLRRNYPDLWGMLLRWDKDSPVSFKPGHTVADYDRRFQLEDEGIISPDGDFRWDMLDGDVQLKFFPVFKRRGRQT